MEIRHIGKYNRGLTAAEIKEYLQDRAKDMKRSTDLRKLYPKFCRIAGVNTMAIEHCEHCGREVSLMYRNDVERFADVLFLNKPTYFD